MSIQILNGLITLKLALTESDRMTYTPEQGEPVWSVEAKVLYMGDGVTVGGVRLTGDIENIEYLLGQLDQRLNQEVSDREDADEDLQDLIDQINNTLSQLSEVAFSGSYNDLSDTPDIPVLSVAGKIGHVELVKSDVGLSNVDDTSDLNKPISTATQGALDLKANEADLADVATSGSFNDLEDVPSLVNSVAGRTGAVTLTKADVGLSNVDNTSDLNKPISTATQSALDLKANEADLADVATSGSYNDLSDTPTIDYPVTSVNSKTGDVVINKTDVGLGNADNTSDLNKPISTATQNALDEKVDSDDLADVATSGSYTDLLDKPTLVNTVNGYSGAVTLDKSDIGLGNVDNTSDINKPISTAVENVLNLKANSTDVTDAISLAVAPKANSADLSVVATSGSYNDLLDKPSVVGQVNSDWTATTGVEEILNKPTTVEGYGITNAVKNADIGITVASLVGGKIPSDQIPAIALTETHVVNSEVAQLALVVQLGDIAVRTDLSTTFVNATGVNGSMSDWTELLAPPNAVQSVNGQTGAVVLSKSNIGLGNVDNTSDINKPISTAVQNALDNKVEYTELSDIAYTGDYDDLINKPTISYPVTSVAGKTGAVTLVKSDVGLSNVDNTSDLNKPISTAVQSALNGKQDAYGSQLASRVLAGPTTGSAEPTFRALVAADIPSLPYVSSSLTLTAGNGLTGGGNLGENRTFTLGTPSNITLSSSNGVTSSSHTHAFAPGGTTVQYIRGDGSLAAFPSIPSTSDFMDLSTAQTTTGRKTFNSGTATPISLGRASTTNLSIEFQLTGSAMYFGQQSAGEMRIGTNSDLSTGNILRINSSMLAAPRLQALTDDSLSIGTSQANNALVVSSYSAQGSGTDGVNVFYDGDACISTSNENFFIFNEHTTGDLVLFTSSSINLSASTIDMYGTTTMNGALNVNTISTTSGNLTINPTGTLAISKATSIAGAFTVTGAAANTIAGNTTFTNALTVGGTTTMNGTLTASGPVNFTGAAVSANSAGYVQGRLRAITQSTGNVSPDTLNAIAMKTATSNVTVTIPNNTGSNNDTITFVNNATSGDMTIVAGASNEIRQGGSVVTNIVLQPYGVVTLLRLSAGLWVAP